MRKREVGTVARGSAWLFYSSAAAHPNSVNSEISLDLTLYPATLRKQSTPLKPLYAVDIP